jgi:hypothetical protein
MICVGQSSLFVPAINDVFDSKAVTLEKYGNLPPKKRRE